VDNKSCIANWQLKCESISRLQLYNQVIVLHKFTPILVFN